MSYRNRGNVSLSLGEKILWEAKPKQSAFLITKSCTLLPIAVLWLIVDLSAIRDMSVRGDFSLSNLIFFAFHLMPVWIWLGNVISAARRYHNTNYYLTNKRIIIQQGFLSVNETTLYYKELRNISFRVDFIDKIFGVGDICFDIGRYDYKGRPVLFTFEELKYPDEEYQRIQRIIFDIQTDIEYPNALRPNKNFGYNTDYNG